MKRKFLSKLGLLPEKKMAFYYLIKVYKASVVVEFIPAISVAKVSRNRYSTTGSSLSENGLEIILVGNSSPIIIIWGKEVVGYKEKTEGGHVDFYMTKFSDVAEAIYEDELFKIKSIEVS